MEKSEKIQLKGYWCENLKAPKWSEETSEKSIFIPESRIQRAGMHKVAKLLLSDGRENGTIKVSHLNFKDLSPAFVKLKQRAFSLRNL